MATSTGDFTVPPGHYPPFAIVSPTDHTAWILIAAALGLSWALLTGVIRIFVRLTISPGAGLDDASVGVATFFGLVQSAVVLSACHNGFGKATNLVLADLRSVILAKLYAAQLLFIITLGLSKLSLVFFLLRLTPIDRHRRVFWAFAAVVTAWMIGSIFAVALQCGPSHPWLFQTKSCAVDMVRGTVSCRRCRQLIHVNSIPLERRSRP